MRLPVPSIGTGGEEVLGANLRSEMVADGIEPALVVKDVASGFEFRDFDETDETLQACTKDADCGDKRYCGYPIGAQVARSGDDENEPDWVCHHYIPILASNHVVELYNGALRRAHGFPQLTPEIVRGLKFDLTVGNSMVQASRKANVIEEKAMLV